ncbi:hypothetical protein HAX54_005947, partial [Datura stramonium]|nr:hypothetical protein [Datura stramonium]
KGSGVNIRARHRLRRRPGPEAKHTGGRTMLSARCLADASRLFPREMAGAPRPL